MTSVYIRDAGKLLSQDGQCFEACSSREGSRGAEGKTRLNPETPNPTIIIIVITIIIITIIISTIIITINVIPKPHIVRVSLPALTSPTSCHAGHSNSPKGDAPPLVARWK